MYRKAEEYIKYIEKMKKNKNASWASWATNTYMATTTGLDVWQVLDHIHISEIERYLRIKKLKNIEKNNE